MNTRLRTAMWAVGVLLLPAAVASAGATPVLVSATFLGSAGGDRIEGVAFGPDGTIYVAGTSEQALASLPAGAKLRGLGRGDDGSTYGYGFVARLDGDGRKLLAAAQFANGPPRVRAGTGRGREARGGRVRTVHAARHGAGIQARSR